jgi:hypothetical protein
MRRPSVIFIFCITCLSTAILSGAAFAAQSREGYVDLMKSLMMLLDHVDGINDIPGFNREMGPATSVRNENPAPGESAYYYWDFTPQGTDATITFGVSAKSGKVESRWVNIDIPESDDGIQNDDNGRVFFANACRAMGSLTKGAVRIREVESYLGFHIYREYIAYFPADAGKLALLRLFVDESNSTVLFSKISRDEEYRYMTPKGDKINVRERADTKSKVLRQVSKKDSFLRVFDEKQNKGEKFPWYNVSNGEVDGWIYGEFLTPLQLKQYTLEEFEEH